MVFLKFAEINLACGAGDSIKPGVEGFMLTPASQAECRSLTFSADFRNRTLDEVRANR